MLNTMDGSMDRRRRHRAVIDRLRAEADLARVAPPPDLHRRILSRLSATPAAGRHPRRATVMARVAACVALLAVAGLAVQRDRATDLAATGQAAAPSGPGLDGLLAAQAGAMDTSLERPLRDEANRLADDARTAGQLLLAQLHILR